MNVFEALCPAPPSWEVRWSDIHATFDWIRRMDSVPQDSVHHAEGDVATHTRMAVESLAGLDEWRRRPVAERVRLFAAVLLHDVAKPDCTQTDPDGRITAHGHSRRGDTTARRLLWELGAPIAWREHVAALIRHHQVPFWALERPDLDRIAFRVSLLARNDDLALLATADILGRVCADAEAVLDNIALFRQYTSELGCLDSPRRFASDHARFAYFRTPLGTSRRDPDYAAYDDTRFTVTVMSGLPGAGKDHWIELHRRGVPVVSLDELRLSMGVKPADDQGAVVAAAFGRAKTFLRSETPYVWNATNLSKSLRDRSIGLAADYGARVEVVSVEAPPQLMRRRNRARPHPVPDAVIDRMARRWELPDPTEAHSVSWILNDR
jgi:predicted kinase